MVACSSRKRQLAFQEPICLSRLAPPWSSQPLQLSGLFALPESLSPVIMSFATPSSVLWPSHTHGTASISSSARPALSQGLRDFAPLNSLQFVSITPALRDVQLHSGLRGEAGSLGAATGWPALQATLTPGRGGLFLCLSSSLIPSGFAGAEVVEVGWSPQFCQRMSLSSSDVGNQRGLTWCLPKRVWQTSKGVIVLIIATITQ